MKSLFRPLQLGAVLAANALTFVASAQTPPPSPPAAAAPAPESAPAAETPNPSPAATTAVEAPAAPVEPGAPAEKALPPAPRLAEREQEVPFGDHIVPEGLRMLEVVSILGSTTVEGEVSRGTVSVLGDTTITPKGRVGRGAVAVLGHLDIKGSAGRDAVGVLGGVTIDGRVGGQVVSVLGDLELGPNAVVERGLVVVGGRLIKHPNAVVRGEQVSVPFFTGLGNLGSVENIAWFTTWLERCAFFGRLLAFGEHLRWAWLVALAFLGFYLLLALLFPGAIERCAVTLETRPGSSLLATVLTVLLTPIAILLLVLTGVGILFVPFILLGLLFATLFGKATMLAWLGRRFTKKFFGEGPLGHVAVAVLLGGALVLLLYTVPILGILIFKLLTWLGLGVAIYTFLLTVKRERAPAGVAARSAPPVAPRPVPPPAPMTMGAVSAPGVPLVAPDTEAHPPTAAIPPASVAATLPRAGFFVRLGALALDGVLVAVLLELSSDFMPYGGRFFDHGSSGLLLLLAIYGAVMWKTKGTTIGGIVCGLKIVRLDQREIDWATAIVRALGCFLSLIVFGLGFIWVAFDPERQSWHDKIAGTTVVRVPRGTALV